MSSLTVFGTGGRLAKVQADGDASDEEEEEWFDASEDVSEEDSASASAGSWWEQANVDAADVEAHLLEDIHGNGIAHWCCMIPHYCAKLRFTGQSICMSMAKDLQGGMKVPVEGVISVALYHKECIRYWLTC